MKIQTEEIHPWKWFVPEGSKVLIIGTFPSARKNWAFDFYYPNPANLFWRIIAQIANAELHYFAGEEAVIERKQLLTQLKLAITDMGYKLLRTGNSSLDENLSLIEYMDIFKILQEQPSIKKIILTSSSGQVSSFKWFRDYLKTQNVIQRFVVGPKPSRHFINFKNRVIEVVVLYSPSPRAANRITLDKMVEMYGNEIF